MLPNPGWWWGYGLSYLFILITLIVFFPLTWWEALLVGFGWSFTLAEGGSAFYKRRHENR